MMLQAVLLASLAIVAHGTICCAPLQWEAFKDFTIIDPSGGQRSRQYYSYDAYNERYAFSSNFTDSVSTYKEIWDYRQGTGCRIYSDKQTCEIFPVTGRFPANCIPGGAVDQGPTTYGFGTDSLNTIGYIFSDTNNETVTLATVSRQDCVPVVTTTTFKRAGSYYSYGLNYNNISPGIRDATVFDPPSYCRRSVMKEVNSLYKSLRAPPTF
ncbi:ependymin-related protein 1-like [Haliotis rubra]|uniref:ependymin-related protein 1-like n=1 Tax=Haliotis rubra TaxID=36100 RepID=UPI001EE5512A|nr:ependymin-related protein 1-like [Haliotis rubra]